MESDQLEDEENFAKVKTFSATDKQTVDSHTREVHEYAASVHF